MKVVVMPNCRSLNYLIYNFQHVFRSNFSNNDKKLSFLVFLTQTKLKNLLHLIPCSLQFIYHLAYLAFQDQLSITQYDFSITVISIDHKLFLCHLFVLLVLEVYTIYIQNRMKIHQTYMIHLLDLIC